MENVVSLCDETIRETSIKTDQTKDVHQQQLWKNEYEKIQKTIKANEASKKKTLHQRKFKTLNNLKYKLKAQIKALTIEENEHKEKATYAEMLRKIRNPSTRQNLKVHSQVWGNFWQLKTL